MIQPTPARLFTAWFGIGSNVDAERNVASGISELRQSMDDLVLSPVYRAPAVGFEGDDYINLVARGRTHLTPWELKRFLAGIEDRHQRRRDVPKFSDRTLDIDILLYEDLWMITPGLDIPRAEILHAAHVLEPLADLDPDLRHPSMGKTLGRIRQETDTAEARLERLDLTF